MTPFSSPQRRAYGIKDEEYLRLKVLTCCLPEIGIDGQFTHTIWRRPLKGYARFDEGELGIGYGCDTVTLTDERVRNSEHKLQPEATTPALYSTSGLL